MHFFSTIVVVLITGNLVFSATYQKTFYESEQYESLFEEFIVKYEKVYKDELEKQIRYEIFKDQLDRINELNARNELAVFGINEFLDYTDQELEMLNGFKLSREPKNVCKTIAENENIFLEADDDKFDWREHNAVTEVKDQGVCGSCYAFSTMGNIEGQYALKSKKLVSLSPQQIIDCDTEDHKCSGGNMAVAMTALIDMGGVMTEEDYPYIDNEDECKLDKSKVIVKLSGCNIFNVTNEDKLKDILKSTGPLSVAIFATDVRNYKGGIMTDGCPGENYRNHGVLLVGWGSENGVPYWILKNSWASTFGERGYFRIKRGINSLCLVSLPSITTSAVLQ